MKFLCVAILIFSGFMKTTSENFKVVGPAAPLVAEAGEDLVLPCSLQPNISAEDMMVEWIRTDQTDTDNLVHLYEDHADRYYDQIKSYRGRTALFKEELQKGNTSLKLSAVQTSDEGVYKCLVKSASWYDDITVQVKVHLKVVGPAAPLVAEAGEDLVLPCSLQPNISAEDMMVEWIRTDRTDTDKLVHLYEDHGDRNDDQMGSYRGRTSLFKTELQKGNTSLKLSAVQPSDEGAYKCLIRYRSWFDDIPVYVEVKEQGFHAWKIAVICFFVFAVILGALTACILKDTCSEKELSPAQCSAVAYMRIKSQYVREELDLKTYNTSEEGYRRLIPAMTNCRKAQFAACNLSVWSIKILSAALQTENSSLKELDLSNNDLQDSGVELLSAGLKSSHCKLEILRLSGCMIKEKGCSSLASALSSNRSHLKELDLTYNYPGESGVKVLSARLEDPQCTLSTLRVEHGGENRIKPGLKKYSCEFTLDPNTMNSFLSLSDGNRNVEFVWSSQSYPDNPERFDYWQQVLCRESLTGRCYWEAEWSGEEVHIAVTYKSISRKGNSADCLFGGNEKSWSLFCSNISYSVYHNNNSTDLSAPLSSSETVGVYVDCPAGSLSFYRVSDDKLTHLHTFNTTFTEPLCAGFWVDSDSSVCLK